MIWYLCGGEDAGLFLEMGLVEVLLVCQALEVLALVVVMDSIT